MTSGSFTTTQGLTPRCPWPIVGSSSTTVSAPRPSLTCLPPPSPRPEPTEPTCRRCSRRAPRHLPQATRTSIPRVPAQRVERFRGRVDANLRDHPVAFNPLVRRVLAASRAERQGTWRAQHWFAVLPPARASHPPAALRSQIHKRTPVQPAHFRFLHLELREDPVPFCVVEARAA